MANHTPDACVGLECYEGSNSPGAGTAAEGIGFLLIVVVICLLANVTELVGMQTRKRFPHGVRVGLHSVWHRFWYRG